MSHQQAELERECRRLAEALTLAERDRQLLGYEIHDEVVQGLTAAALLLDGAGRQATFAAPDGADAFSRALRLVQEAIGKARRLIHDAACAEDSGSDLRSGLAQLIERFSSDHALPVGLNVS